MCRLPTILNLRRLALEVVLEKADLGTVEFSVYHATGFKMDIFHPESRLNIELDGPYHATRLGVRDGRRDDILAHHNIKVIRVPLIRGSLRYVVADVLRLLKCTQDNLVGR